MKSLVSLLLPFALVVFCSAALAENGWENLLAEGRTDAWRSARGDSFPRTGWTLDQGVLTVRKSGGEESRGGGDIITRARYADFELKFEFRLTKGANSGVKFFVQPDLAPIDKVTGKPVPIGSAIGPEFQVLDDATHPDAKAGRNGNRTVGSLYDLIPASAGKVVKPIGEWNAGRIVARGSHVEFWLNGAKTVEFDRSSAAFRQLVSESKYKNIPDFAAWPDGHILLQDHGDEVSFRELWIRTLPKN
jgi:hypothetical protein